MPVTIDDIRPGVWLISKRENEVVSRRRLICTNGRGDDKLFVVSDTGHLMIAETTAMNLFRHYAKDWRVEK